ncbi:MAG: SCO6745 family protein, partial [Trebonia sp.]
MAYGFAPHLVARAIPDAWKFASPEAVLEARITSAAEVLRRQLKDVPAADDGPVGELAPLLWQAVDGCRFDGRPLAAAWSSVPRPQDPFQSLWLAATVLREHRGDG